MAHIAIVENHDGLRELWSILLGRKGHVVYAYPDGGSFMAAASALNFELAIIDMVLPVLDGRDVVLAVSSRIPVIALVATETAQSVDAVLAGATIAVMQPLTNFEFEHTVDAVLWWLKGKGEPSPTFVDRIEEARREAEMLTRLLAGLFDDIPDATFVADQMGRLVAVNTELELLFGYARDEIVGQQAEMLLLDESRGAYLECWRCFIDEPRRSVCGANDTVVFGMRKNGSAFRAEIVLGPRIIMDGLFVVALIRRRRDA